MHCPSTKTHNEHVIPTWKQSCTIMCVLQMFELRVTQRPDQRRRRVSSGSTHRLDSTRVVRMDQLSLTLRLRDRLQHSPRNQQQVTDRPRRSLASSAQLQNQPTTFSCTSTTFTRNQLRTIQYQAQTSRSLLPHTVRPGFSR